MAVSFGPVRRALVSLATLDGTEVSTSDLDVGRIDKSGAKMIIWHGTADEANSYLDNVKGYQAVLEKTPSAAGWLRLFLVPGLQRQQPLLRLRQRRRRQLQLLRDGLHRLGRRRAVANRTG